MISHPGCPTSKVLRTGNGPRPAVMRAALYGLTLLLGLGLMSRPVQSQTLVTRTLVSDPAGINTSPHLIPLRSGGFAVVWGYIANSNDNLTPVPYGRVVDSKGQLVTPVRKNLITAALFPDQRFVAGPTAGGRVLVVGTRKNDSRLVVRALNANLKAVGAQQVARYAGTSPVLLKAITTGAVLGYYGSNTSEIVRLDESGRFASKPTLLTRSSVNFVIDSLAVAPKGYLALGRAFSSAQSRAAAIAVSGDLSKPGALMPYENTPWPCDDTFKTFGAFQDESGLAVFGHGINSGAGAGYRRALLSTGKPKGASKKYPDNITTPAFLMVLPLVGADGFAACYLNGYVNGYIQVLDKRGVPVGDPVAAAAADYSINFEYPGYAWNEASSTLAFAYAVYESTPDPHYEVWVALFKIPAED